MLFHSAQKSCQEATWEFPEREIELVLTQAEQKAVAETWIIVPYKVLTARRTVRHVFHLASCLQRCLWTIAPKVLFYYLHVAIDDIHQCNFHFISVLLDVNDFAQQT